MCIYRKSVNCYTDVQNCVKHMFKLQLTYRVSQILVPICIGHYCILSDMKAQQQIIV